MNHRDVMKKYNELVSVIEKRLGKNTTTDNTELHQVGRELFGARFKGVYAADGVPALTVKEPYAVINNKPAASGGEHWLGACTDSSDWWCVGVRQLRQVTRNATARCTTTGI